MKMTISSTDVVLNINGRRTRLWEGKTEKGVPVVAFVATVAVPEGAQVDHEEFEKDLEEHEPPSELASVFAKDIRFA